MLPARVPSRAQHPQRAWAAAAPTSSYTTVTSFFLPWAGATTAVHQEPRQPSSDASPATCASEEWGETARRRRVGAGAWLKRRRQRQRRQVAGQQWQSCRLCRALYGHSAAAQRRPRPGNSLQAAAHFRRALAGSHAHLHAGPRRERHRCSSGQARWSSHALPKRLTGVQASGEGPSGGLLEFAGSPGLPIQAARSGRKDKPGTTAESGRSGSAATDNISLSGPHIIS